MTSDSLVSIIVLYMVLFTIMLAVYGRYDIATILDDYGIGGDSLVCDGVTVCTCFIIVGFSVDMTISLSKIHTGGAHCSMFR